MTAKTERASGSRDAVNQSYTQVSDNSELKAHGLEGLRTKLLESARDFYEQFVQHAE